MPRRRWLACAGGAGPLAPALEVLAQGDAQLARSQAAILSYVQKLLAMDFDASLQARIAIIVHCLDAPGALPPPEASAPSPVHD